MTDLRKAAQEALEAWDDPAGMKRLCVAMDALRTALEQQQAEPVAWMRPSEDGYDSAFRDHSTVVRCTGNPWTGWVPLYTTPPQQQAEPVAKLFGSLPVYDTTPPQRQWVGLTKVQQDDFADAYGSYEAVCAIEAKLKEKNS